jgi:dienelactone hydrolase/pimeloyl-ACP methyl ester carboxylesterase
MILIALLLSVQEDLSVLKPEDRPKRMLEEQLLAECAKAFDARRREVAALKDPEDVLRRRKLLREKFVAALGGLPERTPLDAKVVGVLERGGYRVEKVVYESRPGHSVTANLYLPEGKGPFPGVLMPMGHSENGKAADYAQRGCVLLARNGLAALCYDPIGQGERKQLLGPDGKAAIRGSTGEHTAVGTGALLVGWCTATFRIWDGIRSLDYLASRPEIDSRRLGCTGCSGGGTLTSYLMALDDRILAAAPSCYVTSLERLFATIGPQDAEQNIPGQVAFGMEHADYVTMRAPRPTLLLTGTRDFFDIQGSWTSFREAKRTYGILGRGEAVDLAEFDMPHGYPKAHREGAVRWMRRWLLGIDDAIVEADFPIERDLDLHCTPTGQVLSSLRGVSAFELVAARARELAASRPRPTREGIVAFLGLGDPDRAQVLRGPKIPRDGYEIEKLVYLPEPGIRLPALRFVPAQGTAAPVLYLHGEGKTKDAGRGGPIEALVRKGHAVVALDLAGMGETAGSEFKESFLAQHLDRPLLVRRVRHVLSVMDSPRVHLVGIGSAAPVALHAALVRPVESLTLERGIASWSAVARTPLAKGQLGNVVPRALLTYDLPDLLRLVEARVVVRLPVDPAGNPIPPDEFEREAGSHKHVEIVR